MRDPEPSPTRRRRLVASVAIALALAAGGQSLLAALATAQGLGGWTQLQGDASHTGFVADAVGPPYQESWHLVAPLGGPTSMFGLSAPVVDGSTVVAVGPEAVVAADLATGRQLWSVDRDYGPSTSPAIAVTAKRRLLIYTEGFGDSPPGTSATPSADVTPSPSPTTSGSAGEAFDSHVAAIDLETQRPAWKSPLQLKEVSRTGVTVDGDTAYLGDNRGNVYAIDVKTGALRWTAAAGGFLTTSLAASDGLVVATVQGSSSARPRVIAFRESDGSRDWDEEVEGAAVFASSPAIADGRVVVGFSDQTVRSFDLADGTQRWSARLNSPVFFTGAPAVTSDAVLVVDTFGQVYRLDPITGERAWDFALNETVPRSPVVVAGDRVLVATTRGLLAAVDLASGRLVWQSGDRGGVLRSLTLTPRAVVAVQAGAEPGLVAFVEDPNGRLVSLVSPTQLDLPKLLLAFLAAAFGVGAVLMLGGRALLARMGPAFLDDDEDEASTMDDRTDDEDRS